MLFLFDALTSLRDGAEITLAAVASDTLDRELVAELGAELATELNAGEVDGAVDGAVAASKLLLRFVFGSALELQARQGVALSLGTAEEGAGSSHRLAREDLVLGVETILRGFSR